MRERMRTRKGSWEKKGGQEQSQKLKPQFKLTKAFVCYDPWIKIHLLLKSRINYMWQKRRRRRKKD